MTIGFGRIVKFRLVARISEEKLIVETETEFHERPISRTWVSGTVRRPFDCLACGKTVEAGSRAWHLAANVMKQVRIHDDCMKRIAA